MIEVPWDQKFGTSCSLNLLKWFPWRCVVMCGVWWLGLQFNQSALRIVNLPGAPFKRWQNNAALVQRIRDFCFWALSFRFQCFQLYSLLFFLVFLSILNVNCVNFLFNIVLRVLSRQCGRRMSALSCSGRPWSRQTERCSALETRHVCCAQGISLSEAAELFQSQAADWV